MKKFNSLQEFIDQSGFESIEEFNRMVALTNMSTDEKIKAFEDWQKNDGTKEGLLKL